MTSQKPPSAVDPTTAEVFVGSSDMARLMREKNWSQTALGPITGWPQGLRAVVRLMLTSRFAMWLGWGEELTFLYNDMYAATTLGAKHPWALGQPSSLVWKEIWAEVWPRIELVLKTGVATWDESLLLFLERSGYLEETYHTFSYSPVSDDQGAICGNFCVVSEETGRVIGERRLTLLKELAAQLSSSNAVSDVCQALARSLATDARDVPFSLTYLASELGDELSLALRTGFAPDQPPVDPALWPLHEVMATASPVLVLLPEGSWPAGPWLRPPRSAIAIPIAQQGQARPAGVFIAAVNPHRRLDETYRSFLTLFVGQLAASLANARAYEAERQRAEALAELDRAKTTFFSNVSHEFRTPLTLLLGPLDELQKRNDLPEAVQRELTLMQRNGLRLLRLVNTLLDFSRIEAGRAQASFEPTDLARYTADLVSGFSSAIERAGLSLHVACEELAEPVYVDHGMWEKIVLNLMSNAFKYTLEGGITVELRRTAESVELSVRDTGSGIPADEMPRLFERFHRVEGARGRTHEGTGIGLALVHELVKLHAGTIRATSQLHRGSTFTVSIPLGVRHLPAEHVLGAVRAAVRPSTISPYVEEALRWLPGHEPDTSSKVREASLAAGQRILLADDSADMREYIRRLLTPLWEVETVADGQAALASLRRQRPALLITDVMMPGLDGFGLLQAVRNDALLRDLPVLMLSARAGDESRLEGLEAGADEYLAKPFTARELVTRVEAQLLRARVRAVEEAHARRLSAVFAQAPVAIAILRGPEHVFELANPYYLSLINRQDVTGLAIRAALPELAGQGVIELLDQVYRTGQTYRARSLPMTLNRGPSGAPEECVFDFVYEPMHDEAGHVEGIAAVAYDVTELALARRQAEVAGVAKDQFLAMLGHELRNPLAPISTALELIKRRGELGNDKEHRVIERQVSHLTRLVDDLLDVSRIARGKLSLHKQRIELYDVVSKAVETTSPLFEKQRHELRIEVPQRGLYVDADPVRMAQVVGNLLTNAAKYTEPGGRILVSAHSEQGQAVLRVCDNGIGIAQDMLHKVFELFVQERQALDRTQGGLGLGLAIVHNLVQLHDGTVSVHSDGPGHGSELTVRLPLSADTQTGEQAQAASQPHESQAPSRLRVLVVDDSEDIAIMMSELLSSWGYETCFALDALTALELAERFEPDVAVLDIGLPVIDGFELARRFRQHPQLTRTRLLAVTGYGQDQDRKRSAEAGFGAHLVKPVDLEKLRKLLG